MKPGTANNGTDVVQGFSKPPAILITEEASPLACSKVMVVPTHVPRAIALDRVVLPAAADITEKSTDPVCVVENVVDGGKEVDIANIKVDKLPCRPLEAVALARVITGDDGVVLARCTGKDDAKIVDTDTELDNTSMVVTLVLAV
jgi:hypothetical protein